MLPYSRPRAWLLALACLTLLFMQMGGAHLHLCFDGNEPPASVHLTDGDHHADHHGGHHATGEVHSDLDVPLANDVLTKPAKLSLDLPLLLLTLLWLGVLGTIRQDERPRDPPQTFATSPQLHLPPLRGPPLHTS